MLLRRRSCNEQRGCKQAHHLRSELKLRGCRCVRALLSRFRGRCVLPSVPQFCGVVSLAPGTGAPPLRQQTAMTVLADMPTAPGE